MQHQRGKIDLGHQTIYSGLSYIFKVDPSWWGRDVYTCDFQAPGVPVETHERVRGDQLLRRLLSLPLLPLDRVHLWFRLRAWPVPGTLEVTELIYTVV